LLSSLTAYQSSPCHVEVILSESDTVVNRPEDEAEGLKKVSKKKQRKERLQGGGPQ
jgi:large subunit ribosomal protein L17e